MLRHLPPGLADSRVIVGLDAPDDAGVYRLTPDLAIVQTVDFFTPVVDDPYAFGQVAAANALSDIYAMGARPITALNLVGFPISKLEQRILAEILRGGADKVHAAGAVILGGHSIDDAEPKYGLAVTGTVHPDQVWAKGGIQPGDRLVLTKPIGVGAVTTAIKRGLAPDAVIAEVTRVMAALNDVVEVIRPFGVHAASDVTGFGLLGHAAEMARASGVGLTIWAEQVPVLPAAREFAAQGVFPGGSKANHRFLAATVSYAASLSENDQLLLCDAVTSGGLLVAVAPEQAEPLAEALAQHGALAHAVIGEAAGAAPGCIYVNG